MTSIVLKSNIDVNFGLTKQIEIRVLETTMPVHSVDVSLQKKEIETLVYHATFGILNRQMSKDGKMKRFNFKNTRKSLNK